MTEPRVRDTTDDVRAETVSRTDLWYAEENPSGLVGLFVGFDATRGAGG